MSRIDFAELRSKVTIEQVCAWLGIKLNRAGDQLRGICPICNDGGPRALVVTPSKGLWKTFCTTCDCGGDIIELVVRMKGLNHRDAAQEIADQFLSPIPVQATPKPFDAGKYSEGLEYEHEAVQALGIPADVAKRLSIGYARKGIMATRVVFPLRNPDGSIVGFAGFNAEKDPPLKLPRL